MGGAAAVLAATGRLTGLADIMSTERRAPGLLSNTSNVLCHVNSKFDYRRLKTAPVVPAAKHLVVSVDRGDRLHCPPCQAAGGASVALVSCSC